MKSGIIALAALGAAAYLLFNTKKGEQLRGKLSDHAEDLGNNLAKILSKSGDSLESLRAMIANEIGGLSEDARERIMNILDESAATGKGIKKKLKATIS